MAESSPTLGDAAEEWLIWLAAARAPRTRPVYRTPLRLLVAHVGSASSLAALTPGQVAAWIATLYAGRRRNTVCTYVSSVRSFLKWCWRQGYTARDVGSFIESPRREESARWPVPAAGVRALLAAAATPVERALVLVLYGCGLRVSEAVGLRWADIDLEGGRALVRGKGSRQRYVGLGEAVTAALVDVRGKLHLGKVGTESIGPVSNVGTDESDRFAQPASMKAVGTGPVPRSQGKLHASIGRLGNTGRDIGLPTGTMNREGVGGRPFHRSQPTTPSQGAAQRPFPYTSRWAQKHIDKLAARAGLGHLTPHQLRHSFADALVGDDVPILQVKDLMGHSSLETTLQYLRARDRQRAVEALRKRNPADLLGA